MGDEPVGAPGRRYPAVLPFTVLIQARGVGGVVGTRWALMFALISAACVETRELSNDGEERKEWHILSGSDVDSYGVLLRTSERTVWAEKRAMKEVSRSVAVKSELTKLTARDWICRESVIALRCLLSASAREEATCWTRWSTLLVQAARRAVRGR